MGTEPSAPARPDEAPSQRRTERRWIPALAVLGVIALVTGGGRGISDALSDVSGVIDVSDALRVHPVAGWTVDGPHQGEGFRTVLLTHGTAAMQVTAAPGVRQPFEILDAYVGAVLESGLGRLRVGQPQAATIGGRPAAKVGYFGITEGGVAVEGVVVTAGAPSGEEVVFDVVAPQGDLATVAQDVVRMIETAELR
jgi:hypothetical protein